MKLISNKMILKSFFVGILWMGCLTSGQDVSEEEEEVDHSKNITGLAINDTAGIFDKALEPYCFRFTWIGPYPSKENIKNEKCPDYNNLPCAYPIVATHNNNVPDTNKLWKENGANPQSFGCMLKNGYSCIKWTYYFKEQVQNITYYCAKVNTTNGCYREKDITGMETEVCVCQSKSGQTPCNSGPLLTPSLPILLSFIIIMQFIKFYYLFVHK